MATEAAPARDHAGEPVRWNLATKGANVTVPTAEEIAGGAHPASLRIAGAGTIMSCDGVVAGAGEEVFWQVKFSETGRGSWVGLVPVPVAVEDRGARGVEGGGQDAAMDGWPDGDKSLSSTGWAIWGGETGDIHPMYIKGKVRDQCVGFKAGQTVGLHLKVTRGAGAAAGVHSVSYWIDDKEVCEAFMADELPQDGSCRLHLAVSNNGWGGETWAAARSVPPPRRRVE